MYLTHIIIIKFYTFMCFCHAYLIPFLVDIIFFLYQLYIAQSLILYIFIPCFLIMMDKNNKNYFNNEVSFNCDRKFLLLIF